MGKGVPKEREVQAPKRLERELEYMKEFSYTLPAFRELQVDKLYPFRWTALLLADNEPYTDGVFKIEIIFPKDYPFRPPRILFLTKIYHPNIDSQGRICLAMLNYEHWIPTTRMDQIIQALVALLNDPDPTDPKVDALAQEYIHNQEKFKGIAMHTTRKYSEPRPPELKPQKKKKGPPGAKKK